VAHDRLCDRRHLVRESAVAEAARLASDQILDLHRAGGHARFLIAHDIARADKEKMSNVSVAALAGASAPRLSRSFALA
jgi:hypothetical protein